jgi:hypothetical protein
VPCGVCSLAAGAGWAPAGGDGDAVRLAARAIRRGGPPLAGSPARRRGPCWSPRPPAGAVAAGCGCARPGLASLAAEAGLEITVCRVAADASRWSKVERGLVSRIFTSWALFALGGSRRLLDR